MKLISAIIAIYIIGLLLVPCCDVHAENDLDNPKIEIKDLHENHIDTCSPFCVCDCCQSLSHPGFNHYFSYFSSLIGVVIPHIYRCPLSAPIDLWRPPKI